jgi:methionyl-tRNA formyltransferase
VILAGSRGFGLAVYEMLREEGHQVPAVWSPDDIADKLTRHVRPAKAETLWTPPEVRIPQVVESAEADLFVAAHSHDFIGRQSRAATKLGGIGYHPSLLPRHRGRDAVRWTIHMGDPIGGGSVYWLTDSVDAGPIARQDWCHVHPGWDAHDLWRKRLFPLGVELLKHTLRDLDGGLIVEVPQEEAAATWEPSWERPPLHRPELPQLGNGVPGYRHVTIKQ